MIRKLDEENLTYAFPEVAFDNDYVIATYQAKVKTSNIEKLAMAIAGGEARNRVWNHIRSKPGSNFPGHRHRRWISGDPTRHSVPVSTFHALRLNREKGEGRF